MKKESMGSELRRNLTHLDPHDFRYDFVGKAGRLLLKQRKQSADETEKAPFFSRKRWLTRRRFVELVIGSGAYRIGASSVAIGAEEHEAIRSIPAKIEQNPNFMTDASRALSDAPSKIPDVLAAIPRNWSDTIEKFERTDVVFAGQYERSVPIIFDQHIVLRTGNGEFRKGLVEVQDWNVSDSMPRKNPVRFGDRLANVGVGIGIIFGASRYMKQHENTRMSRRRFLATVAGGAGFGAYMEAGARIVASMPSQEK